MRRPVLSLIFSGMLLSVISTVMATQGFAKDYVALGSVDSESGAFFERADPGDTVLISVIDGFMQLTKIGGLPVTGLTAKGGKVKNGFCYEGSAEVLLPDVGYRIYDYTACFWNDQSWEAYFFVDDNGEISELSSSGIYY